MFDARSEPHGVPADALARARAHWVDVGLLAWDSDVETCVLIHAADGELHVEGGDVVGGLPVALTECDDGSLLAARFPHLVQHRLWRLPALSRESLAAMLRGALAVVGRNADGEPCAASGVQTAGVIDSLYAAAARASLCDVPLGLTWRAGRPTVSLWAPTARGVTLLHCAGGFTRSPRRCAMSLDAATGIWRIVGDPDWCGDYYRFEVDVYMDAAGGFVRNVVTDPYSVSLSINSAYSQFIDLNDAALQPPGWTALRCAGVASPTDAAIYELHVRDFSIYDESVPAADRGKYLAFTHTDSRGMRHLRRLAEAGMTHVQLLPVFDFATVDEDPARRTELDPGALALLPPDSEAQTTVIQALRATDGYNWGYDPFHFSAPEGSYASDPDGAARVYEFRAMVQALAACGLGVVLDVVFNHTFASGLSEKSVLDRIVPGYYHRRTLDGSVEHSTCCENTASEHAMMEQLILDSVRSWAVHYKIAGFRFDLMGHHMLSNMAAVRRVLDELTLARDGVDGRRLLLYGEGWSFGEVDSNARGRNAAQRNLGGSGIGSFNDRLRDAVRGGSPFSDPRAEGFATGMFYEAAEPASDSLQRSRLETSDWLKLGLAGTLADYELSTLTGVRRGDQILYGGQPAGYAREPAEVVNYVSAHDNETLFDKVQWAAPDEANIEQRVRMNMLALSMVVFAQGIPFFHAGDEFLRSKSLDANSFNSSDWFNAIDWTMVGNGWGRGLPPSVPQHWDAARALLRDAALRPSTAHAEFMCAMFCDMLRIRRECELLRLRTADEIVRRVRFCNCGPQQVPGLIVMYIDGAGTSNQNGLLAVWNATSITLETPVPIAAGRCFTLHQFLRHSVDPLTRDASFDCGSGMLRLPALTAGIFV